MTSRGNSTQTIRDGGDATIRLKPVPGLLLLFDGTARPADGIYPRQREISIGRGADCVIFLEDPGLSRRHAVVRWEKSTLTVEDCGSHNGTFLNGRQIRGTEPLPFGAILRCGRALITALADTRPYRGWRDWGMTGPLIGGPEIRLIREEIRTFAASSLEVLILGESGTGKEVVAGLVHELSGRPGPLVAANCAELPESLFEAELFGARKGAFTGADQDRPGLLRSAHRGTLFLDELTELPLSLQAKLLRVVEQKKVRPLGSSRSLDLDVRLVAATNRDLAAEVARGDFRQDLYHRLRGAEILLPPLRERRNDIPLLVAHLQPRRAPATSVVAMERFLLHRWPGNVRELDRALREATARATARGADHVLPDHLRPELRENAGPKDQATDQLIRALKACKGNVMHTAQELGMSRAQVYKLLKERGLSPGNFRR